MRDCCDHQHADSLAARQAGVLRSVFTINAGMFAAEFGAGLLIGSTALLGDSLDMLGDALVYGLSLYALARSQRWRNGAALVKGVVMAGFGLAVLTHALLQLAQGGAPMSGPMAAVAALALGANAICFALLYRYRAADLNMRSAWLCSRNDLIANAGVLIAAAVVHATGSGWPDILVGVAIAVLFLASSAGVLRAAAGALRGRRAAGSPG
jgi:cation diffusion facilitator family transporter